MNDKYEKEMDGNFKKLLASALGPVSAAVSFSRRLMLQLREEMARTSGKKAPETESGPAFEENLGRLMASGLSQAGASPAFKERLLRQLITAREPEKQTTGRRVWITALATAAILVLILGFAIYPNFWADRGAEVAARVNQGTGTVVQEKPLFFIWGSRTVTSEIDAGDTISLAENDHISTARDSLMTITMASESSLKLYPESELVINDLDYKDENGVPAVSVMLNSGRATSEINNITYELETPTAVTTVPGTVFRVEVITTDHTYVATSEGVVKLTMDGDTVEVTEGEEVDAIKGQPLVVKAERPPMLIIENPERPEVSTERVVLSGKTDIEATLRVDGNPVPVDITGSFSISLELTPGANPVSITATSPTGKTTIINLILVLK